jgi:hypothetical protein
MSSEASEGLIKSRIANGRGFEDKIQSMADAFIRSLDDRNALKKNPSFRDSVVAEMRERFLMAASD